MRFFLIYMHANAIFYIYILLYICVYTCIPSRACTILDGIYGKIIESHVMNKVFIMLTTMIVISLSFIVMLPVLEKQCCFVSKVQKVFDLETPLITPGSETIAVLDFVSTS